MYSPILFHPVRPRLLCSVADCCFFPFSIGARAWRAAISRIGRRSCLPHFHRSRPRCLIDSITGLGRSILVWLGSEPPRFGTYMNILDPECLNCSISGLVHPELYLFRCGTRLGMPVEILRRYCSEQFIWVWLDTLYNISIYHIYTNQRHVHQRDCLTHPGVDAWCARLQVAARASSRSNSDTWCRFSYVCGRRERARAVSGGRLVI